MTVIKETDYMLVLKYAARILFDKEMIESTGRARGFDLDKALQNGFQSPGLALQVACGKSKSECTKEDLAALRNASTLVVDYLMLSGELERLKTEMLKEGWRIVLEEVKAEKAPMASIKSTVTVFNNEDDARKAAGF